MADRLMALPAFPVSSIERTGGVRITARENIAIIGMTARESEIASLVSAFKEAYGLDLPMKPARIEKDGLGVVWVGRYQWLVMSGATNLEEILRARFAGYAAIVDHTDARAVVSISGPRARDLLAKGLSIDLHPRVFAPGSAAATAILHIGVYIWQRDEEPAFELAVPRTYAGSLWRWMEHASAEFQNS